MDPERSPEPRRFNPSRFADNPCNLYQSATGDYTKRDNYVFGAGRRMCQGIHIAERSLFLGISRLMWAFHFSPAADANGDPVKYDIEDLVGSITVEPNNYLAKITPRSPERVALVRQEAAACRALLHPETRQWKTPPTGMLFSTYTPQDIDA
jgi:Cytochrome P450